VNHSARKPWSAPAPANGMPVADNQEDKNEECDYKQTGSFSGVDRVAAMLGAGVVLARGGEHGNIVRSSQRVPVLGCIRRRRENLDPTNSEGGNEQRNAFHS
jgi:hypothetical protein